MECFGDSARTCSSTRPPTLLLAVTKAVTSSSISLSKSSIERGTGSGGEGAGASIAVAAAAPPPAPTAAIPAIEGCPFACGEAPSTVEAMSSSRDVAASSLRELRRQHRINRAREQRAPENALLTRS